VREALQQLGHDRLGVRHLGSQEQQQRLDELVQNCFGRLSPVPVLFAKHLNERVEENVGIQRTPFVTHLPRLLQSKHHGKMPRQRLHKVSRGQVGQPGL
jgi:hypothetical protein